MSAQVLRWWNIASRCHQLKRLTDTNHGSATAPIWDGQTSLLLGPQLRSLSHTQRLYLHMKGNFSNLSENKGFYYSDTSRKTLCCDCRFISCLSRLPNAPQRPVIKRKDFYESRYGSRTTGVIPPYFLSSCHTSETRRAATPDCGSDPLYRPRVLIIYDRRGRKFYRLVKLTLAAFKLGGFGQYSSNTSVFWRSLFQISSRSLPSLGTHCI
jgi:hypothetical protein